MANMEDTEEQQMQDLEQLLLLENARRTAEDNYTRNPYDSDNLTNWGMALLELSRLRGDTQESKRMVKEAISKLQEALDMEPKKHKALFHLGNAYVTDGFQTLDDPTIALAYLDKATQCYGMAVDEDPQNELYLKTLAASAQAPIMYMELQGVQQRQTQAHTQSSTSANSAWKKKSSDLKYDICGWIVLGMGIVVWIGMLRARSNVPPPVR